ncbi:MAG: type toxin-antitoxin system Phd/YefM family antitoxin [Hydrocarboniphaga sp.]|uniref:type II toxin-antitoxin system Phd/YefM family antitoxin n=1 Tax=Hydrocarboniphaga sp. TaxID=2033016 RepID=UPI00260F1C7E|nr:type II toxin-antitoxin system prevent-host-death family antitoxin [Hydrocarboniphaga sp.]MDB5970240.1 type toxin-antitoxin system Phd/YefM family antitoxin [Hydrocarboniphaga sp.]
MKTVNLHEAKTHLSALVSAAAAGEEIVIAKSGKPMARLVPLAQKEPRKPGLLKGMTVPESFFDPLPEDELKAWEG